MARTEGEIYRVVLEELPLTVRERLLLEGIEQREWVLIVHRLLSRQFREREVKVWWLEPHAHLRGYAPGVAAPGPRGVSARGVCHDALFEQETNILTRRRFDNVGYRQ